MKLEKRKENLFIRNLFNPDGDDCCEGIYSGNPNGIFRINKSANKAACALRKQMRENFWIPEKIPLINDINDYANLTEYEKNAAKGILSYLTFLDSIQTVNLAYLKLPVKNSGFDMCISEQISQEATHAESYQYIIDTVIPSEDREEAYKFWQKNEVLRDRCHYLADFYQAYADNPTEQTYSYMLLASYLLEGIYFYNGFIFFYTLANRKLLSSTTDIIKLIHRDELTHVRLDQLLIKGRIKEGLFDVDEADLLCMFDAAVKQEQKWAYSIIGDNVLGITKSSIKNYTEYLANLRLTAIGYPKLYPDATNPYVHLEKFADLDQENNTKSNFFEATVTNYQMSSSVSNWDF